MKLQINYNVPDLEHALSLAHQTAEFADILEIGSLLIFNKGIAAINEFKNQFPDKPIYADTKISSHGEETVKLFATTQLQYLSVFAGAYYSIIREATKTASTYNIKVVLDFFSALSLGQSAMEAKTLGVYAILLHRNNVPDGNDDFFNQWQEVSANTDLPIFIKGKINKKILGELVHLKPHGVVVGSSITKASNPRQEAKELHDLIKNV